MLCIKCKSNKEPQEFPKRHRYDYTCRLCINAYMRKYSKTHKQPQLPKTIRSQAFIDGYKNKPCMDCDNLFPPECMDFDHRNPEEKINNVSTLKNRVGKKKLLEEINKCDVVCANCHRIRTAKQLRAHRTTN